MVFVIVTNQNVHSASYIWSSLYSFFQFFSRYAKIIATGLAASINAGVIEMSGFVFQIIARKITSWEHPRYRQHP